MKTVFQWYIRYRIIQLLQSQTVRRAIVQTFTKLIWCLIWQDPCLTTILVTSDITWRNSMSSLTIFWIPFKYQKEIFSLCVATAIFKNYSCVIWVDHCRYGAVIIWEFCFLDPSIWKTFHFRIGDWKVKTCVPRRDWNVKMHRWEERVRERSFTSVVARMVEIQIDIRSRF